MYLGSKILPLFVLPVGFVVILLLSGLLFRRRWVIWTGLAVLWLGSTPLVGGFLIRAAEEWADRIPAGEAKGADAIVVLSGGRIVAPGRARISEWTDADRFFGGVELFQAGKAPLLIFTGGATPGDAQAPLEGTVVAAYAKALGVPPDRMLTTGPVFNTADEARAVADVLQKRQSAHAHILLVTSAFHMPRARRLFEHAGFRVTAFPVDFSHPDGGGVSVLHLLPNAGALVQTQTAIREMYGRLFYLLSSIVR